MYRVSPCPNFICPMVHPLFWITPVASLVALAVAFHFYSSMKKRDEGTFLMKKIAKISARRL